jgi:hypothetical protein
MKSSGRQAFRRRLRMPVDRPGLPGSAKDGNRPTWSVFTGQEPLGETYVRHQGGEPERRRPHNGGLISGLPSQGPSPANGAVPVTRWAGARRRGGAGSRSRVRAPHPPARTR